MFITHLYPTGQILSVFGIKCLEISGSMRAPERTQTLHEFRDNRDREKSRVLLISNVGMEGLNIHFACVLITLVRFLLTLHPFTANPPHC